MKYRGKYKKICLHSILETIFHQILICFRIKSQIIVLYEIELNYFFQQQQKKEAKAGVKRINGNCIASYCNFNSFYIVFCSFYFQLFQNLFLLSLL
jgi:hypothetical protein